MNNKLRVRVLLPLLAGLASVWASSANANPCDGGVPVQLHKAAPGVGGTGAPMQPGVGGTGRQPEPGVGGTGRSIEPGVGGTGSALKTVEGDSFVYGVITGFASICVNGLEVQYESSTPVVSNGESSSIQALKVGQWVAVSARGVGREVNATSISIEQPIGGPVTRIDAASKTIEVMGQAVRLGPDTNPRQLPKVGDSVAVSGFVLPNGAIQASRIDPMAGNAPAFASGRLTDLSKVLNVPIDAKSGASASSGKAVRVRGKWDGSRLNAASVKETDSTVQLKPGAKFHVQAYVSDNGRAIQAAGKEIPGLRAQVGELREAAGKVAVLRGQIDSNGRAEIQSIESVPVEKILDRGGRRQLSDDSQEKELKRAEKKSDDLQREVEREAEERAEEAEELRIEVAEEQLKALERSQKDVAKDKSAERTEKSRNLEKLDRGTRADKADKGDKVERIEKTSRPERSERVEKVDKAERIERVEKVERVERAERSERPEKVERPEKIDRPEKIERPEKVDRPEKIERPERRD